MVLFLFVWLADGDIIDYNDVADSKYDNKADFSTLRCEQQIEAQNSRMIVVYCCNSENKRRGVHDTKRCTSELKMQNRLKRPSCKIQVQKRQDRLVISDIPNFYSSFQWSGRVLEEMLKHH